MSSGKLFCIYLLALSLGGCADLTDVGTPPELTPVGSGINLTTGSGPVANVIEERRLKDTDVIGGPVDFFRDQKARKPGDTVTVIIDIDDRASLDNRSSRSREGNVKGKLNIGYEVFKEKLSDLAGQANIEGKSSSKGEGRTARSETVSMSVAAVVTDVMPNGLLVIQGSQEVLVNAEKRVLGIRGLVNPRDISGNNKVSYERIAEARISYGGRGRMTEVQQPGLLMQLWDRISPY